MVISRVYGSTASEVAWFCSVLTGERRWPDDACIPRSKRKRDSADAEVRHGQVCR